jgi:hypothetical protein
MAVPGTDESASEGGEAVVDSATPAEIKRRTAVAAVALP